jgi:gliding motility-associated-like protein
VTDTHVPNMKKFSFSFLILAITCFHVQGQLCNGSLGDPVVHITFGNGVSPSGPLKAGVTNMRYTTGCPNDGEYTITSSLPGCFGNTWHNLIQDHTADNGGRFMVANASFAPSDFYVDTVSGLCGNTVYELAAWVANALLPRSCNGAGIKPNLTFKIETISGTVLQKFDSGDIPSESALTWKQYGTFFTTPAGTGTVVLRITNNGIGGCGNDLILDDITFRSCGPKVATHTENSIVDSISVCENDSRDIRLEATYAGNSFVDPVMQWQVWSEATKAWSDISGERNSIYIRRATAKGTYLYRVVIAERSNFGSSQCRLASSVTTVDVAAFPNGAGYTTVRGCTGSDTKIEALQGTDLRYQWSGPNGFTSTAATVILPKIDYRDSGLYKVTIATKLNCTRTDSFRVAVSQGAKAIVGAGGNICEGNSIPLTASGGITYQWVPSTGLSNSMSANPVASPVDSTLYQVTVTNQSGCKDSATVAVNVYKRLIVDAGPDKSILAGATVMLDGTVKGTALNIYWMPTINMQNANSLTPLVTPTDKTTYTLFAVAGSGCPVESDSVVVNVYKSLNIPNIFSPNGDGVNDTWMIPNIDDYPQASIKVFSRSGQLVFEAKSGSREWNGTYNGKPLPLATYYYVIDLNIGRPVLSGPIVIIR